MTNAINPGMLLPFYNGSRYNHSKKRGLRAKIVASHKCLLPFQVYFAGPALPVQRLYLVNIDTQEVIELSTALIIRNQANDNSGTWYNFNGGDIGLTIPCGEYNVHLVIGGIELTSEEILIKVIDGPEYFTLSTQSCSEGLNFTVAVNDTNVRSGVSSISARWRFDGFTNSTWMQPISIVGNDITVSLTGVTGHVLPQLEVTVVSNAGNVLKQVFNFPHDDNDFCGLGRVTLEGRNESQYINPDMWAIEFEQVYVYNNILYPSGFIQRAYVTAHFDNPSIVRTEELLVNTQGTELVGHSVVKNRQQLIIESVPDEWLPVFNDLRSQNTIELKRQSFNESITLSFSEVSFESTPLNGGQASRGVLSWEEEKAFYNNCETSIATSPV